MTLDDFLEQRRNAFRQIRRRLVEDREREFPPPVVPPGNVLDLLVEEVLVGDHALFAGRGANPRGFDADPLDRAGDRAIVDRVAAAERPVEQDRERREQVGEDALCRKADRDAADTEARDQPGDIDPEIVEHDHQRDREQREGDEQADDPHRAAQRLARIIFRTGTMLDRPEDNLARPDRGLKHCGDGEKKGDRPGDLGRRVGVARDQFRRDHDDEEIAGADDRPAEHGAPARRSGAAPAQIVAEPAQEKKSDDDDDRDGNGDDDLQPVALDP